MAFEVEDGTGKTDATSYASVEEADEVIGAEDPGWAALDTSAKQQRLNKGTALVDALPQAWTGSAANEDQALGWPRVGMYNRNGFAIPENQIPAGLRLSVIETARQDANSERTADNDVANQGIESLKAGSVALSFREVDTSGNIVSDNATALLAVNNMVPDYAKALLVPSWLKATVSQDSAGGNFLFMTLG